MLLQQRGHFLRCIIIYIKNNTTVVLLYVDIYHGKPSLDIQRWRERIHDSFKERACYRVISLSRMCGMRERERELYHDIVLQDNIP